MTWRSFHLLETFLNIIGIFPKVYHVLATTYLHVNWKAQVTCCIEVGGLVNVTSSHIHCKNGNMSEMVHNSGGITTDH